MREAGDQGGRDVERPMAGPVVAQWEGVAAATAEGMVVREQAVAPDGRAGAGGEGHGVKRDVLCRPKLPEVPDG